MFIKFSKPIIEYQNITIFRHQNPDGDAACSQMALKLWIEKNFKDKKVKVLGDGLFDVFPYHDEADDEFIKSSLAIVLDTANTARIDDQRFKLADKIMKIDHHPITEEYGDINIVNPRSSSTCELLTFLFLDGDVIGYRVTPECASYLYAGIVSDTQSFTTSNTTQWTLNAASNLADLKIEVSDITAKMCAKSYKEFKLANHLRSMTQLNEGLAYVTLNKEQLVKLETSGNDAKNLVFELNNINEFMIWMIAVENDDDAYDVSIRSKSGYPINLIANSYGGGGHANAAGIKGLPKPQLEQLKKELIEHIKKIDIQN